MFCAVNISVRVSEPFTKCHSNRVKWHYWLKLDFESVACKHFYCTEYSNRGFVRRLHLNFDHDQLGSAIDIGICSKIRYQNNELV